MYIEHLTITGSRILTLGNEIPAEVIDLFKPFQVKECQDLVIELPKLDFKILLTTNEQGANLAFFYGKFNTPNFHPFSKVVCCFNHDFTELMQKEMLRDITSANFHNPRPRHDFVKPQLNQWISTIAYRWAHKLDLKKVAEITPHIYYIMH